MSIKCTANEQVKRLYFHFLEHADGKSEASIKQVNIALGRFEDFTGHADFRTFDQKQAVAFKEDMRSRNLAPATILATVKQVMRKRRLRLIDFASVRSLTWLRERFLQQTEGWHGEWCRRI